MEMTATDLRNVLKGNLKSRRAELGLTQAAAAAAAGITQAYWAQLESGQRVPQFDVIADLSEALRTTPDALLTPEIFSKILESGVEA